MRFSFYTTWLMLLMLPLAAQAKVDDVGDRTATRSDTQQIQNVNSDPIYNPTIRLAQQGTVGAQDPVAVERDRRAGSGQQTSGQGISGIPTPVVEADEFCSRDNALSSLRDIMRWQGNGFELEQCREAMQRNIMLFCISLMLLFWSYQLNSTAGSYPLEQNDNTNMDLAAAAAKLTSFPLFMAIATYAFLSLETNRILAGSSDWNDFDRSFANLFLYVPVGDNLFLLMLLGAILLSATALFKIGMAQSRLGAATSGGLKLIAILPPTLSTCASGMTIVKAFLI
jgi:hypothetical protein